MSISLLVLVGLLAYANGSNDNSKGVATLVGYGAATPTKALIYGAITTAIGAAISFGFSGGLLKSFSTGLFAKGTPLDVPFFICVLILRVFLLVEKFVKGQPPNVKIPFQKLGIPGLYFGVLGFNLSMTFLIGEITMGWASTFIVLLLLMLFFNHLTFCAKMKPSAL